MHHDPLPVTTRWAWTPVALLLAAFVAGCGTDEPNLEPALDLAVTEVFDADGESLGSIALNVACSESANASLRLGLALMHNMTYTKAASAFEQASELDPECALAPWGVAMTYVHPLWPDTPSDEQLQRGWALLQEARDRGPKTSLEEAYVSALEDYYRDGLGRNEPARLATYAVGWEQVAKDHPDDLEAALFRSLSLQATAPGSAETRLEAGQIAEAVLRQIPNHPGAQHYVIHAYDLPSLADQALPVAHTYGGVAPENSHALHMTSHIFTLVGAWEESIRYNVRAADIALSEPINGATSHHHLHSIDYLAYAYLQRGDDAHAQEVLDHLIALDGPAFEHAVTAYAYAAIPARVALERQRWADAAALEARQPVTLAWDRYSHLEAITEFARALGAAHTGDLRAAERSLARIETLHGETVARPTPYDWGMAVKIQEVSARAWIAYASGRVDEALEAMREAATLEASHVKHAVTPGEVLPAGELLGDMLLDMDRYGEARAAYDATLERSPNRFNSLYGAGRAAELAGVTDAAADYYRRLVAIAADADPKRPQLEHAESFLKRRES